MLTLVSFTVLFLAQAVPEGPLRVGGTPLRDAWSEVEIETEVLEIKDGEAESPRLVPGRAVYRLFIESARLIPVIEASSLPGTPNPYLEVNAEDGRTFTRCLVESSSTFTVHNRHGRERRTRYGLRCEAVLL